MELMHDSVCRPDSARGVGLRECTFGPPCMSAMELPIAVAAEGEEGRRMPDSGEP